MQSEGDPSRAALISFLSLQRDWGADEALFDDAQDRTKPAIVPSARAAVKSTRATILPLPPVSPVLEATTLAALRAALERFDHCALKRTATQLVFADGSETARIMLVGEAPGAEEDRAGLPFVGPAGQLLDRMLASIGLDRSAVRIVNVVPWRPPGNRAPSDTEIAQCLPFLHRHIALVRPQRLLLLGAIAVRALVGGKEGITRVRGTWKTIEIPGLDTPVRALPTYHPAYLLRQPAAKRAAWSDLLTLRQDCVEVGIMHDAAMRNTQPITKS
ncbi:uracil-DNA glycosylase [Acidiphilium sp.]|uniref:uracil-DNA glycosylase n=1 Tax=Acidiphilium sp. TaxID=527 RepID=UPI003D0683E6